MPDTKQNCSIMITIYNGEGNIAKQCDRLDDVVGNYNAKY